jgi:hypothetical protein
MVLPLMAVAIAFFFLTLVVLFQFFALSVSRSCLV